MISRLPGKTVAGLRRISNKLVLVLYFFKKHMPRNMVANIMLNKSAVEKKGYFYAAEEVDEQSLDPVLKVLNLPSSMIAESFLTGDELHVSFRLHNSDLKALNSIIRARDQEGAKFKVLFLGRSNGIVKVLNRINRDFPLSVLRFKVSREKATLGKSDSSKEILGESDTRRITEGDSKMILYPDHDLDWATPISVEDHLYRVDLKEPFTRTLTDKAYKAMIPIMAFFGNTSTDSIEFTTFLPTDDVELMIPIFFSLAFEMDRTRSILELCVPLEEEVWNWL